MNVKPSSNYFIDDSGDNEINIYDTVEHSDPIAKLWNTNLSDIQKQILELILISKNKKIIYNIYTLYIFLNYYQKGQNWHGVVLKNSSLYATEPD